MVVAMNKFVKALEKNGEGLLYLRSMFPDLNDSKIKQGIAVGPLIRKVRFHGNFKR
jgi:hypothetical protein